MAKRMCRECEKRPAKFIYKGYVKADADHDLCMQCYRKLRDATARKN